MVGRATGSALKASQETMAVENSPRSASRATASGRALLGSVDAGAMRAEIVRIGYAIAPNVVDPAVLDHLRNFWLAEFTKPCPVAPIVCGPYLGEANGALFDESPTHCLYRSYDYLWNSPYDTLTRQVAIALNRVRNRIIGEHDHYGELMDAERYGIYVTTSYYPCGSGWMHMHRDMFENRRHWHFVLPLTFRGEQYATGGLNLIDREGERIDVEERIPTGAVLFYDGALMHGVERIEGMEGLRAGRLQMFAIPMFFDLPRDNQRHAADLSTRLFVRAKLSRLKWRMVRATTR